MTGRIMVGGQPVPFASGDTIATALARQAANRSLPPPPMFCGIGQCQACLVLVTGRGIFEACLTPCEDGLRVELVDARHAGDRHD